MNDQIFDELEPSNHEKFKLEEIEILSELIANDLVGKHIKFTNHIRKDKSKITLLGKVLNYKNGIFTIYVNDILYEPDVPPLDEELEQVSINNITNVVVFKEYNEDFINDFQNIKHNEFDLIYDIYVITNIYGESIEGVIVDLDSFNMELVYKNSNEELEQIEYPIYFIKSVEPKRDKKKEV